MREVQAPQVGIDAPAREDQGRTVAGDRERRAGPSFSNLKSLLETGSPALEGPYPVQNAHAAKA